MRSQRKRHGGERQMDTGPQVKEVATTDKASISFAFKGSAMSIDDEFWLYKFGEWTHHPRLECETDEQVFARIKVETERERGYTDIHSSGPMSWDAVNLPSQEPS